MEKYFMGEEKIIENQSSFNMKKYLEYLYGIIRAGLNDTENGTRKFWNLTNNQR